MKFSKDTSRLVEGRTYWATGDDHRPIRRHYDAGDARLNLLWGDECPSCGSQVYPPGWRHRQWCTTKEWVPVHLAHLRSTP
jgi:hypothetical protein